MINIKELSNSIFKYLKKEIDKNNQYNAQIKKNVVDKMYPLVVFEENANILDSQTRDIYRLDIVRNLSFEISIFAITQNNIDSSIICDELANIISGVMEGKFGMQGGLDACLKNINTDKATKYVMHYNCKWNVRQNIIY